MGVLQLHELAGMILQNCPGYHEDHSALYRCSCVLDCYRLSDHAPSYEVQLIMHTCDSYREIGCKKHTVFAAHSVLPTQLRKYIRQCVYVQS